MLIFLYGQDTYRLQQKLKEIEEQYKKIHKGGLNLEKIDANYTSFREFWDNLFQRSMFIKKKLFFLENTFSDETFKDEFSKKVKDIAKSQDIVVCFEKKEVPKTDKLFLCLQKQAKCQSFKILTGQKLRTWVKKEFAKYGAEIEEKALNKLIDFVGSELWQMNNEIKKLAAYRRAPTKSRPPTSSMRSGVVIESDVKLFVKPKIEPVIFKTIDALAEGNKKRALRLLQNHLEKGDSPFYVLKMISWQFRNLLLVKSSIPESGFSSYWTVANSLSKKLNMKPFVVKKTIAQMKRFSFEELKKIYRKIFEADLAIKTGSIQAEEGLRMLIAEI